MHNRAKEPVHFYTDSFLNSRGTEENHKRTTHVPTSMDTSLMCIWIRYLVRVVLKGAVVTLVPNAIQICVPLVHIVDIGAIIFLIQNA